jgi:hypothetical protein
MSLSGNFRLHDSHFTEIRTIGSTNPCGLVINVFGLELNPLGSRRGTSFCAHGRYLNDYGKYA